MGFAAALPALAIGGTAFGTATSAYAASQQNKAISQSMSSQRQASIATQQQVVDQAAIEQMKAARQAHQIEGRLRVAAADSGAGIGGSWTALLQQNDYDAALNANIIANNEKNQLAQVASGYNANIASLQSGFVSPILQAFTGALGGLQSGLAIGSSVNQYQQLQQTPQLDPYNPVTAPTFKI